MTDERRETRDESQQVANAPGRNFPPGTPFEIGELSRLVNAIGRSGMQLFTSDLVPVINVPADDSRTDGKSVVSNHALRMIRDVLIWLTRNEATETT